MKLQKPSYCKAHCLEFGFYNYVNNECSVGSKREEEKIKEEKIEEEKIEEEKIKEEKIKEEKIKAVKRRKEERLWNNQD